MTCKCNICKKHRGEITDKELEQCLNNDVKRFKKILADKKSSKNDLWSAEINKDEAEYMLWELTKKKNK